MQADSAVTSTISLVLLCHAPGTLFPMLGSEKMTAIDMAHASSLECFSESCFGTAVLALPSRSQERESDYTNRGASFSTCSLHSNSCAMADPDGAQLDLRTVFVKGVSFDWTDKDFEGALSDIGPLRKCFLLKGAGKNHKVKFSYFPRKATGPSPPSCMCIAALNSAYVFFRSQD